MASSKSCTNGATPKSFNQMCEMLGINRETGRRLIILSELTDEIQKMVEDGKVTVSDATRLISKLSHDEQEAFCDEFRDRAKITHEEVDFFCNTTIPIVRWLVETAQQIHSSMKLLGINNYQEWLSHMEMVSSQ